MLLSYVLLVFNNVVNVDLFMLEYNQASGMSIRPTPKNMGNKQDTGYPNALFWPTRLACAFPGGFSLFGIFDEVYTLRKVK